jgi:predicted transcriptional regulator
MDSDEIRQEKESTDTESELQQWQVEHIQAAIRQADEGRFIEHAEVRKAAQEWRRSGRRESKD